MASDRDAVTRRMRPGAWDTDGFLADDESLAERVAADLATCTALGTTPAIMGRRLLDLLGEATRPVDAVPAVDDEVDVERSVTVGAHQVTIRPGAARATCPWSIEQDEVCLRGPGGNPSGDEFTIERGGRSLDGLTLSAHLIGEHRFFGGLESRFRIDPAQAHAILIDDVAGSSDHPPGAPDDALLDQLADDLADELIHDLIDDRPDDSRNDA